MESITSSSDQRKHHYSSRDAAWCVVADALMPVTGLVVALYLTRQLGPVLYGLYSLLYSILLSISLIISSVCRRATISRISLEKDWIPAASEALRVYFILGIMFSLGLFLAAPLVAVILRLPEVTFLLRLYALEIVFFSIVAPHRLMFIARGLFHIRAILGCVYLIGRMLFIVVLVASGLSIEGVILGNILATFSELIAARFFAPIPFKLCHRIDTGKLFRFALPLMAYDFCFEIALRSDLIIFRLFGGEKEALGHYAAAQMVAFIPLYLTMTLSAIVLATAIRLANGDDRAGFRELAQQMIKTLFWIFPFCSIIAGSASSVLVVLFGAPYSQASEVLTVLCFLPGLIMIARIAANLLVADNNASVPVRLLLPVLPVMFCIAAILVPRYGAVGAAWSIVLTFCLLALLFLVALYRFRLISIEIGEICKVLLLTIAVFVLSSNWQTEKAWLVLEGVSLAGLVIVVLFLIGQIGKKELAIFRSIISGRKST